MRVLLAFLGYINGKLGVKCTKCLRLKNGKCLWRQIPADEQSKSRTCALWKKRHVWIRRQSAVQDTTIKLKTPSE